MTQRRNDAKKTPKRQYEYFLRQHMAAAPAIRVEVPREVYYARDRAQEARKLLHRYLKGQPTARRPCIASGMSDGAWRRARRSLMAAGIFDRKAQMIYHGRDATLRLESYLAQVERRCYQSRRYVSP